MATEMATETAEELAGIDLLLGGKHIVIGRLSTRQLLRIMRLASGAYSRMDELQRERLIRTANIFQESSNPGVDSEAAKVAAEVRTREAGRIALTALLEILDEDTVGSLQAILTKQDKDWCLDHLGLLENVQIAEAMVKQELLTEVVATFQRVVKGWQPPTKS